MNLPSNELKKEVWDAYYRRQPTRVPLRWSSNVRIILLDPALNPDGDVIAVFGIRLRMSM